MLNLQFYKELQKKNLNTKSKKEMNNVAMIQKKLTQLIDNYLNFRKSMV